MRPQKILQDDAAYHVTSQIDHGATAPEGAGVKRMLLDLVEKAKKKFDFELWNFTCLGCRRNKRQEACPYKAACGKRRFKRLSYTVYHGKHRARRQNHHR
jgi:hypothetical protein